MNQLTAIRQLPVRCADDYKHEHRTLVLGKPAQEYECGPLLMATLDHFEDVLVALIRQMPLGTRTLMGKRVRRDLIQTALGTRGPGMPIESVDELLLENPWMMDMVSNQAMDQELDPEDDMTDIENEVADMVFYLWLRAVYRDVVLARICWRLGERTN